MINAGMYNKRISIVKVQEIKDNDGFKINNEVVVLNTWASINTTKGFTLIASGSDFEKAYTNFRIRFPKVEINRDMIIKYANKTYTIEYLNNIDENSVELEIQAKVVVK